MENNSTTLKLIRKDAVVNINIPAGLIEKLIEVLSYLLKDITPEQQQQYEKELPSFLEIFKKEKTFSEEWMYHVSIMSLLIEQIQREADSQGQTYEDTLENYIKASVGEFNPEDNQPADQSQSQPE